MKTGAGDLSPVSLPARHHSTCPAVCPWFSRQGEYPCSCKETKPVSQLISSQSWAGGWLYWMSLDAVHCLASFYETEFINSDDKMEPIDLARILASILCLWKIGSGI